MNFFTKVFVSPIKEIKEAIAKKRKDGINDNEFELQTAKPGYINNENINFVDCIFIILDHLILLYQINKEQ